MPAFTFDRESTILEATEIAAFAHLVQDECYLHDQHVISVMLSRVTRPFGPYSMDIVVSQVSRMWRVER